jgi:hypothetical protein
MDFCRFPSRLCQQVAQGDSVSPADYAEALEGIWAHERAIGKAIKRHVLRMAYYDGRRLEVAMRLMR